MNKWACMGLSFSKALGIEFAEFVERVGHDGGDESSHKGFHPQECIDVAVDLGFSCTPIQLFCGMVYDEDKPPIVIWDKPDAFERFRIYMGRTPRGVCEGIRLRNQVGKGVGHAVALVDGLIYDNDKIYHYSECSKHNFHPQTLWIIKKVAVNEQIS
jgi:hypothetical protein